MSTCHITKPQDIENLFLFFAENTTTSRIAKLNPKEEQVLKNVSNKMKQIFNINGYRFNTIQFIELIKRILATLKTEDSLVIKGSKKTSKRSSKKTSKRSSKKTSKRVSKKNGGTKKIKYSEENSEETELYNNNEKNTMYNTIQGLGLDFIAVMCLVVAILLSLFAFTIFKNLTCSANEYGELSETAISALKDTLKRLDESNPNDKNFFIFIFNILTDFWSSFVSKQQTVIINFLKEYFLNTIAPELQDKIRQNCMVNLGELTGNSDLDSFFNYAANAANTALNSESSLDCSMKITKTVMKKIAMDNEIALDFMITKINGDVVKILRFINFAYRLGGSAVGILIYRIGNKLLRRKAISQKKLEIVDNPQELLRIDNPQELLPTKSSKKMQQKNNLTKSSKKMQEKNDLTKSSEKMQEKNNLKKPRVSKRKTSNIDE
jgi:hypothetical protein